MTATMNLLGLSGSLRQQSAHTAILRTVAERLPEHVQLTLHELNNVPPYNEDDDGAHPPQAVIALRAAVAAADGLVIGSPEYNHGMSGVLKNALDWASRPGFNSPLKNKPVLIMTSSPGVLGGVRAQSQLRETLSATLSRVICSPQIVIPGVNQKIQNGSFSDETTIQFMIVAVNELIREIKLLE